MSIFMELKRRNVYKVAALYIIVGWVVLQMVDLFMSFMPLPEWTSRLVFVLLAAGFPVAIVLAWAIELTADGIKLEKTKRSDAVIYGLLALVAGAWLWSLDWGQEAAVSEPAEIRSLAVLPLSNLMNDPEQAYFVEGMHDALITELSKIKALHVISRTSAMKYLDSAKSVPEIAEELGVDAIIEGSVLRAGKTVRVTAQLIEARSDRHLWADNFDRELTDILALYADVTREIVEQIRIEVTPEEVARLENAKAVDANAYELYLKGKYFCDKWGPEDMRHGIELMRQAVTADPDNALAQAGLGVCLQYASFFGYVASLEIAAEANTAAERAIALDRGMAEAWASLAGVRYYLNFDLIAAEMAVERAIALNPSHVRALVHYAWQLGEAGRFEEALDVSQQAIELDPLATGALSTAAQAYYLHNDFDTAVVEWRKILESDPTEPAFHYYVAWAEEQLGKFDEAINLHMRAVELSHRAPLYLGGLAYSYGLAGRTDDAQLILDELLQLHESGDAEPFAIAMAHLGLGNHSAALDWLEKAFAERNSHMLYIKQAAQFDPLRDDPRFALLIQKMGW